MLAQVNIIPIGTGEELKELVAKTLAIVEKSELDYQLTAMGTILEGEWEEIMFVIRKCHDEIKQFSKRVVTEIVIDDRADAKGRLKGKVLDVEYVMGKGLKTGGLT